MEHGMAGALRETSTLMMDLSWVDLWFVLTMAYFVYRVAIDMKEWERRDHERINDENTIGRIKKSMEAEINATVKLMIEGLFES